MQTRNRLAAGARGHRRPGSSIDSGNVFRLQALLALRHFESDLLSFIQTPTPCSINRAEVHKHVRAVFAFDETITLVIVEPLDDTGNQLT